MDMTQRAVIAGLAVIAAIAAGTTLLRATLFAQARGEVVEFLVTANDADDILTADVVVFTGRSLGVVSIGDCDNDGEGPLQPVVVIDPREGRPTRNIFVIPAFREMPVRSGTRVANLQTFGSCDGGTSVRFRGTVE